MSTGRKLINCTRCNKFKLNFGKQMCSACLRRTKRETVPSFYLGTCYSEMSRRVKTFDPKRPNYYGLPICSKNEFIDKFVTNEQFLKLYMNWQENNYKRFYAPSIDRIDTKKGYTLDNIEFIIQNENSKKDNRIKIIIETSFEKLLFFSCQEASRWLGIKESSFCRARKTGFVKGYKVYEIT